MSITGAKESGFHGYTKTQRVLREPTKGFTLILIPSN